MYKTQCPECAKKGKDRGRDNLVVYPDGHQYCFSCGYLVSATGTQRLRSKMDTTQPRVEEYSYPYDVQETIPEKAAAWLSSYGLSRFEFSWASVLWSESRQLLIFPIKQAGTLKGWIGRYFGDNPKFPKWYIKGPIKEEPYIIGKQMDSVVLCEDLISAIKLSRYTQVCPIFGASISKDLGLKLKALGITKVIIWLDPDKQKESLKFGTILSSLGLKPFPIFSDYDPKEHDSEYIKKVLSECQS